MTQPALTPADAELFRNRVEYEDQVLTSRTTVVLELNALGAVAVGLGLPTGAKVATAVILAIIDVLWLVCAIDASWLIKQLNRELGRANAVSRDEQFRWTVQKGRIRISTTTFLALWIPSLLLIGWLVGLLLAAGSSPAPLPAVTSQALSIAGIVLVFGGAAVLAWGLVISQEEAIELGSSYWSGQTNKEMLKVPPVRDRLRQSRNAKWGLGMMLLGSVFQVIALWP